MFNPALVNIMKLIVVMEKAITINYLSSSSTLKLILPNQITTSPTTSMIETFSILIMMIFIN